jgi:hypothetical protein
MGLGAPSHQILGFLETGAGDFGSLDDVDFVGAGAVGITVNSVFSSTAAAGPRRPPVLPRPRNRRGQSTAFASNYQLRCLEQAQTLNLICDCVDVRHGSLTPDFLNSCRGYAKRSL